MSQEENQMSDLETKISVRRVGANTAHADVGLSNDSLNIASGLELPWKNWLWADLELQ
jgi:hypothetical protein